jgi:hypothetical protein
MSILFSPSFFLCFQTAHAETALALIQSHSRRPRRTSNEGILPERKGKHKETKQEELLRVTAKLKLKRRTSETP